MQSKLIAAYVRSTHHIRQNDIIVWLLCRCRRGSPHQSRGGFARTYRVIVFVCGRVCVCVCCGFVPLTMHDLYIIYTYMYK